MQELTQEELNTLTEMFEPAIVAALCSGGCDSEDDTLHTLLSLTIEEL